MSRPSTYKQSSRKGKKAWRKNIDIEDIETKIQEQAENEVNYGVKNVDSLKDDKLFEVDDEGDERLSKLVKKTKHGKVTKSKDILNKINQQSKVPALSSYNRSSKNKDKIQGVEKKQLKKLLQLAGKSLKSGDKSSAHLERRGGLVKGTKKDLWADEGSETKLSNPSEGFLPLKKSQFETIKNLPESLLTDSLVAFSKATVKPTTLGQAPIKVAAVEDAALIQGKSYNPDMSNWERLFEKEYLTEKDRDDKRKIIEEYKLKIQYLMDTLEDKEIADSSDEEENEAAEEEDSDEEKYKLSVNPAVQNIKKNRVKRNKERKNKERMDLEKEIKDVKSKLKEMGNLLTLEEQERETTSEQGAVEVLKNLPSVLEFCEKRVQRKRKLGTKNQIMEPMLEIKFKDEISGSLRKLKPEGSLLYDSMIKLQSKGIVETRSVYRKGKKPKRKVTEKWVYKDFK